MTHGAEYLSVYTDTPSAPARILTRLSSPARDGSSKAVDVAQSPSQESGSWVSGALSPVRLERARGLKCCRQEPGKSSSDSDLQQHHRLPPIRYPFSLDRQPQHHPSRVMLQSPRRLEDQQPRPQRRAAKNPTERASPFSDVITIVRKHCQLQPRRTSMASPPPPIRSSTRHGPRRWSPPFLNATRSAAPPSISKCWSPAQYVSLSRRQQTSPPVAAESGSRGNAAAACPGALISPPALNLPPHVPDSPSHAPFHRPMHLPDPSRCRSVTLRSLGSDSQFINKVS